MKAESARVERVQHQRVHAGRREARLGRKPGHARQSALQGHLRQLRRPLRAQHARGADAHVPGAHLRGVGSAVGAPTGFVLAVVRSTRG